MRFLTLALLGLIIAAGPVQAAPATERPSGGAQRVQQPSSAGKQGAVVQPRSPSARGSSHKAGQRSARRSSQPAVRRSAPVAGQLGAMRDTQAASSAATLAGCSSRQSEARCRTTRISWSAGLPPAAGIQANECPHGTMATLARGHEDIVRCMPI